MWLRQAQRSVGSHTTGQSPVFLPSWAESRGLAGTQAQAGPSSSLRGLFQEALLSPGDGRSSGSSGGSAGSKASQAVDQLI